jgi:hypothetical protein
MAERPKINSASERELDKVQKQLDAFEGQVKDLTMDRMNETPKAELEPQTKIAASDISKTKDIYLKPKRAIGSKEKFNEKYREKYNFDKEYVHFIAENKEIIGETIDMWTKPYAGLPAEWWEIPVNKPVWGPRYLAEQLKRKYYHRLKTEDRPVSSEGGMTYMGQMVVDTTIPRLDAHPVSSRKSIFMGSSGF